ncbi:MAG: DUF2283 domain-containing protein [Chloroflexi bacterium]|nr:DUF2283 domain-containing protein [Chloroflexota bacterium]
MAETDPIDHMKAYYDADEDILYLTFVAQAEASIAEEVADEVYVRFNPDTHKITTIEFLNMSARLIGAFGPELEFNASSMPERELLSFRED